MNLQGRTVEINPNPKSKCRIIADNLISHKSDACFALVSSKTPDHSYLLQRYNTNSDGEDRTGFFTTPGNRKGRNKFAEKLSPLLGSLHYVEKEMRELLAKRGLKGGSDVVVMVSSDVQVYGNDDVISISPQVVNDGEMDLFVNFACSCRHYGLSLHNIVVFAASGCVLR